MCTAVVALLIQEVIMFGFYDEWSEDNIRDWEIKRKKGVLIFCLKYGVLIWGGLIFAGTFFGRHIINFIMNNAIDCSSLFFDLLFGFFFSAMLGFIYGWSLWVKTEKQYNMKFLKKND